LEPAAGRSTRPFLARARRPLARTALMSSQLSMLTYPTMVTHAVNFTCALVGLALLDRLAIQPWVRSKVAKDKDVKMARWFFTHAAANLAVVITGTPALWTMLTDPANAMDSRKYNDFSVFGSASPIPLTFINAVHVYHMVGGFQLSGADYFHHLLFIPFLGFPGQILQWGAMEPAGAWFISGAPGGLSYLMLGLLKLGYMDAMTEKRFSANLNVWLRVPGILLTSFVVYQAILYERHTLPLTFAVLQVVLPFYNSLYYAKQAIANYTVHYMTSLLKQDEAMLKRMEDLKLSKEGNFSITNTKQNIRMSWQEALAVPQRGC